MSQILNLGGNDLKVDRVYVGATTPDSAGTLLSGSEISVLDGVTAGTVTASKAVVVGASKEIGSLGTVTLADSANVVTNATTGTKIGTATSQKIGFWNATPVIQQASANQGAVTLTAGAALATTAATQATPYGFDQAQADGLIARVNAILVDNIALNALVTRLRLDLVTTGVIKGAA